MTSRNLISTPHNLTNFLVVYFNCSYFMCFSPFRFVRDENNGLFKIHKRLSQMIICALLHTLVLFSMVASLRSKYSQFPSRLDISPVTYFEHLDTLFVFAQKICTLKNFWLHQPHFLCVVNFIQKEANWLTCCTTPTMMRNKSCSWGICLVFAVMAVYQPFWDVIVAPSETWAKTVWNRHLVSRGQYLFFMTSVTEKHQKEPEPGDLSILDYFLAVLAGIERIQRSISDYFPDLSLISAVLTVWVASYQLARKLQAEMDISSDDIAFTTKVFTKTNNASSSISNNISDVEIPAVRKVKWSGISRKYYGIRGLCENVNKAFGSMITLYVGVYIMYQSTKIDIIFEPAPWTHKLKRLFFIVTSSGMLWLSADVCEQMSSLKQWISKEENRRDISTDELNVVMGEVGSREIGIKCSNNFTITFPFLWNILTTVVTFFIICMQTRQDEAKEKIRVGM